ncbi:MULTISPECIES: helix-turn-helix domain-containing protein [Cryobacterium]|uniref:helix-turn-helix domain-containing protein n=1 Tax=Cryobacterium TaxID=69578 RepID=UPI000CD3B50B|nr:MULTISPECIES: helix-turn-helix domain-containing protein [Cryobacterium]POH64559.1 hypothetical protein C3B60_14100 [Cryobacterium zongtaii]TFC46269.1 helix-turn-helix domain-containing protein [Cryobacterium sp. TMN-39-2]
MALSIQPAPGDAADYALLQAIVEAAPDPLWVISDDGSVARTNTAGARLLGYADPDQLVGLPSHATLHHLHPDGSTYSAEDCPIVHNGHSRAAQAPELFLSRTGEIVPVIWSIRKLKVGGAALLSFATSESLAEKARFQLAQGEDAVRSAARRLGIAPTRTALRSEMLRQIREHFADPDFNALSLAANNHISVRTLQMIFAAAGTTPAATIRGVRLEFARHLIDRGSTVQRATFDSGYREPSAFARAFRRQYGVPPSQHSSSRAPDDNEIEDDGGW